ncbi:MAG: ribosome silencing factor [Coraliomargaritaceae bacterium]
MPATDLKNTKETLEEIRTVVGALEEKKAENIRILDVAETSSITDYIVLATGTSDPHLKAMKAELDGALKTSGIQLIGQDREVGSGWVVVDAFDFMVHLQTESIRDLYRLDQLWKDANEVMLK